MPKVTLAAATPRNRRDGSRAAGGDGWANVAVVLACTLLAAGLRLVWLDHESLWFDEAATMKMVSAGYLLTGTDADQGNPPGYFLLARCWTDLLGARTVENVRAFSALAGALAVPAVWWLARTLRLPRGASWLGCFLVAVSPPMVYLGQEARVFALFMVVATLALTFAVRIQQTDRRAAWVGLAVTGVALVYLHYYGFFVLTVLGLDLLGWAWRERNGRAVGRLFLCAVAVALAFLPWLPTFQWQLALGAARSKDTWWQQLAVLPLFGIVGRTLVWKEAGQAFVAATTLLIVAVVYVPLVGAVWRAARRPWPLVTFTAGLPLLVALVSLKAPMVHTHYLSVILPALTLLLAFGLHAAWLRRDRLGLGLPALALAVLLPTSLARLYLVQHKNDWRTLAARVARDDPGLPVCFYEDIGEEAFAYYWHDRGLLVKLDRPFGADGDGWHRAGYFDRFHSYPEGFWLILYLPRSETTAEEPAIRAALGGEFAVEERAAPPLKLLRCRPRTSQKDEG
jgi:4-amino-4-deoxy-L-arabinose transferase-like glycosyltransferase